MTIEKIEESGSLFQTFADFLQEEKKAYDIERLQTRCKKIITYGEAYCVKHEEDTASYLCFYANDTESRMGFITAIKTSPRFRGQGYAKALAAYCFSVMKSKGMTKCRLEVRKDNEVAIRLYERLGFLPIGDCMNRKDYIVMEAAL